MAVRYRHVLALLAATASVTLAGACGKSTTPGTGAGPGVPPVIAATPGSGTTATPGTPLIPPPPRPDEFLVLLSAAGLLGPDQTYLMSLALVASSLNRGELPGPPARTLVFPGDSSLGTLFAREWGATGNAEFLSEAKGSVTVEGNREVWLEVSWENWEDLSPLDSLAPDALHVIDLSTTGVGDSGVAHLAGLTRLQHLNLNGTQVGAAGLAHIESLKMLQVLDLNATRVTDPGMIHVRELPSLTVLNLWSTAVGDEGVAHLKGMGRLRSLNLGGTAITDDGLVHLQTLPALEDLGLSHTEITDEGLVHLSGLTYLKTLDLTGTSITDEGLEHLRGLASLTWISLGGSAVTVEGMKRLREVMPNVSISHPQAPKTPTPVPVRSPSPTPRRQAIS